MAGESRKARITRMHRQYETLCEFIPTVKCQLDFHTPFELLVATMLSAQTTDKRVNSITPERFGTYPTAAALADARLEDVESIIRPLGFYHVKAEHIIAVARQIVERFGGQIPQTMEELTSLPGVGRKTANVVLGNAFRVPGFPVATHVIRVTGRLHRRDDWMKTSTPPARIEQEIRDNMRKLQGKNAKPPASAAAKPVSVSADDFNDDCCVCSQSRSCRSPGV